MKRLTLLAVLCFTAFAFGQETRSTLTGHVADSSGAGIPDAAIQVTNTQTGVVTNAKSNSAGDYTVPFLQPGTYRSMRRTLGSTSTCTRVSFCRRNRR